MPRTLQSQLEKTYKLLQHLKQKKYFFDRCREKNLIPKGLQLKFNLAFGIFDFSLIKDIEDILNKASTNLLDTLYLKVCEQIILVEETLKITRKELEGVVGCYKSNEIVGNIRKHYESFFVNERKRLDKKIHYLVKTNKCTSTLVENKRHQGSKRIFSTKYQKPKSTSNPESVIRKHRQNRRRGGLKNKKQNKNKQKVKDNLPSDFIPSEEDLSKFDPIVLTNIELTPEQISICRLPDCFAPTPREPIDVSDQLIGTHNWAERLRWHHHFQTKENLDSQIDNKENFIKQPWYVKTKNRAPKKDTALEAFIQACTSDFLAIDKRKKISDNLTKGQRQALSQLKKLPLTHNAACRFADKSGNTVITDLEQDDTRILEELKDEKHFDAFNNDPTPVITKKIENFTSKWKGTIDEDIVKFVTDIKNAKPGKVKPLIKTHKPPPFPTRLLLSGCGTPVQPLSKFVQVAISHLTSLLPYQVLDSKEFLAKTLEINEKFPPLPDTAVIATCDVVALFPNVDNSMGVPATRRMLKEHPSTLNVPTQCIIEALELALDNNVCGYTPSDGTTVYAQPNMGTAMGPAHSCDYVDIYMGELDEKLVDTCPVPLLSTSTLDNHELADFKHLDWSRFRDDGITILMDPDHVQPFIDHLQALNPPNIKWTVKCGKEADYLDIHLALTDGKITTDVFSKNCNSYLPPHSCHSPSVFKGLISGVGTRLRMLCSDTETLRKRIDEYAKYFAMSGWEYNIALKELRKGANKDRKELLTKPRKKKPEKIAWVTTYDPRLPTKAAIIRKNLHLLYQNPKNKNIFPKELIIAADRRRKNLGEIYKPTTPARMVQHGPKQEPGFFTCKAKRCDTCAHAVETKRIKSPWDGRTWKINKHLTCTTKNIVYIIICKIHPDVAWYIGSCKDLKARWRNHKSDTKRKQTQKCTVAQHCAHSSHDLQGNLDFLQIIPIDSVQNEDTLLRREVYFISNIGTLFFGLNTRNDLIGFSQ